MDCGSSGLGSSHCQGLSVVFFGKKLNLVAYYLLEHAMQCPVYKHWNYSLYVIWEIPFVCKKGFYYTKKCTATSSAMYSKLELYCDVSYCSEGMQSNASNVSSACILILIFSEYFVEG